MNRFLVVVIGKGYVHPSYVLCRDISFLRDRLIEESRPSNFIYLVYSYLDKIDSFLPIGYCTKGQYFDSDKYLYPRVRYDG